jgi:hypothetical protein
MRRLIINIKKKRPIKQKNHVLTYQELNYLITEYKTKWQIKVTKDNLTLITDLFKIDFPTVEDAKEFVYVKGFYVTEEDLKKFTAQFKEIHSEIAGEQVLRMQVL